MHPQVTIYQTIASYERFDSVASVMRNRGHFIKRQPAYVASILNRMENDYNHFTQYERPVIRRMAGIRQPYTHSSAGRYEIDILKIYQIIQESMKKYRPRINTRA